MSFHSLYSYLENLKCSSWATFRCLVGVAQVSMSSKFLCINFLYKRRFSSYFWLRFGFGKKFVRKMRAKNGDEIDHRPDLEEAGRSNFIHSCKMLVKFTPTTRQLCHDIWQRVVYTTCPMSLYYRSNI